MTDAQEQLFKDAIQRGLVVFAPKDARNLREQYPTLKALPQFDKLSTEDMLFVWLFRCSCSPLDGYSDKEKLHLCIDLAWQSEEVREKKKQTWAGAKKGVFPPSYQAAFETMGGFNTSAMILRYQSAKTLLNNMMEIIMSPLPEDPGEQDSYVVRTTKAQALIDNIAKSLQKNEYAVEESKDTILPALMGRIKESRLSQN